MYVLRILGLFTLLLSLSSFSEAVKNTEKSVVVNTATTKAVENKSKPKKKTFSPPKKGKKATTRVATTTKKRHKLFVAIFALKEVVFSSKNKLVTHLCQIGKSFELVPLGYN